MKIVTLILRMRFDERELHGSLEDPVSGWHTVFASLDDLGVRLREVQGEEHIRGDGRMAALPEEDDQDNSIITSK